MDKFKRVVWKRSCGERAGSCRGVFIWVWVVYIWGFNSLYGCMIFFNIFLKLKDKYLFVWKLVFFLNKKY